MLVLHWEQFWPLGLCEPYLLRICFHLVEHWLEDVQFLVPFDKFIIYSFKLSVLDLLSFPSFGLVDIYCLAQEDCRM